jgi:hypothetical protein
MYLNDLIALYGGVIALFVPLEFYALNIYTNDMYNSSGVYIGKFDRDLVYEQLTLKMPVGD